MWASLRPGACRAPGARPRPWRATRAWPRSRRLTLGSAPPWWRGHRSILIRWAGAIALATVSVALVSSVSGRAERTLAAYGTLRRVPVARHDLAMGHVLSAEDIEWRDLPRAAVPSDVVAGSPVGHTVVDRLARGEVIGDLRVAPGGLSPLAATVGPGQRAVAIPRPAGGLHLAVGDRVDVIAPRRLGGDLTTTDGRGEGAPVVAGAAAVLAVGDTDVVVAVSRARRQGGGRRPGPGHTRARPARPVRRLAEPGGYRKRSLAKRPQAGPLSEGPIKSSRPGRRR